jgi:dihydroorotase
VLAEETGARVHITHVSTALSAALVGWFKARNPNVTGDTTPHHLTLTDELVGTLEGMYRVNPPLRPDDHRLAVGAALADGTLDFVATDHAPHTPDEKARPLQEAAPGFLGHETAFSVLYTDLVLGGRLTLERLVEAMSNAPGAWMGGGLGRIEPGAPADLVLADLSEEWEVRSEEILSQSRNTPYLGRRLTGRVVGTFVGGEVVHDRVGARLGV